MRDAARLNPKSLWVYRSQLQHTQAPEEKIKLLQHIVEVFPLANPTYYLQLAELAVQLNRPEEAIRVLELGLSRFPINFTGYQSGNFFGMLTPSYESWRARAPELLEQLKKDK